MESKKQPWEAMKLIYVGHVAEIVQQVGKLSPALDPGNNRQAKGQG